MSLLPFSSAPPPKLPLSVLNGGTGSSTKNFVDLTTAQTIAGAKTFSTSVTTPTINAPTGRAATLTVAASNATALEKSQADYVCTGTGDEVQINDAIVALAANGGYIYLSSGTFTVANPIVLSTSQCVIQGAGMDVTHIVLGNSANCNVFTYVGSANITMNALYSMTIDGNKSGNTSGYGIYINPASTYTFWDFVCRDVWTKECAQDGYYAYDGHGYVLDHFISEYNDGNGITFEVGGIDEPEVKNGTIKLNGGTGILMGANQGVVTQNEVQDNSGHGIELHSIGAIAMNNIISANTLSGIHMTAQPGQQSLYNTVLSNGQHGVLCDTGQGLIMGNYLKGNSQTTANTYDEVQIANNACTVSYNIIDGSSSSRYGINFSMSWTVGELAAYNTITGMSTANTNNAGSATFVTPTLTTYAENNVTVTTNAGSCSVAYKINNFTNSSAATMAITIPTTGAVDGQLMIVRIYDFSAVAQTLGWTNTENSTVTVPTTSNGSTTLPLTVGFQYNSATSKWRCIASA